MKRSVFNAVCLSMIAGLAQAASKTPAPVHPKPRPHAHSVLASGVSKQYIDPSMRPQDDFYHYQSGKWLKDTEMPADKLMLDGFSRVEDTLHPQLRALVEQAAADQAKLPGSDAQTIGDFYASYMNTELIEQRGLAPLQPTLDRIAQISDKRALPALFAELGPIGVTLPFVFEIEQDAKESTRYAAVIRQSGLGLPNRDYYLSPNDAKLSETLAQYTRHIERTLALAGDREAAAHARSIVAFETAIARIHRSAVDNRDPGKLYNKVALAQLATLAPGFDWQQYLASAGVAGRVDALIVNQPDYLRALAVLLEATPLETLKLSARWHLLSQYQQLLPQAFADERFAFYGTTLAGVKENTPRWKRGVGRVDTLLGDALGKLYVAKHFPPERKARIDTIVRNLMAVFRTNIDQLDWMSPATKQQAQAKLAKMTVKIGYPERWRDYSALDVRPDDLIGNVLRAQRFEFERQLAKLGTPIDRSEWAMTPQEVNAYYGPELNEIAFPAAILQPPFFDADAEDAVNYGAIGAVIGHELSHAFDDQGSQYDGEGNLRNWWQEADRAAFQAKADVLIKQYGQYSPLPGYHVNGALTIGENLADLSGTAIALKAYQLSLQGKQPPVIDGLTGTQRFYMGWGQVWRSKVREAFQISLLKKDPHSPGEFRVNGPLMHQDAFYEAFKVKPGDKMYLAPKERVSVW